MVTADPAGTVRIPVRAGDLALSTLIDIADAKRLGDRRLSLGSHGYVQLWDKQVVLLHRWILGLKSGDRRNGDHINGDVLDNRRANLRAVSPRGSSQNRPGSSRSGYRGVHRARSGRWTARVKHIGVTHYLGTFATKEEAALVADAKRRELMPEYAGIWSRRTGPGRQERRTAAYRASRRVIAEEIRAWARSQGVAVGERGRIPVRIIAAYETRLDQEAS